MMFDLYAVFVLMMVFVCFLILVFWLSRRFSTWINKIILLGVLIFGGYTIYMLCSYVTYNVYKLQIPSGGEPSYLVRLFAVSEISILPLQILLVAAVYFPGNWFVRQADSVKRKVKFYSILGLLVIAVFYTVGMAYSYRKLNGEYTRLKAAGFPVTLNEANSTYLSSINDEAKKLLFGPEVEEREQNILKNTEEFIDEDYNYQGGYHNKFKNINIILKDELKFKKLISDNKDAVSCFLNIKEKPFSGVRVDTENTLKHAAFEQLMTVATADAYLKSKNIDELIENLAKIDDVSTVVCKSFPLYYPGYFIASKEIITNVLEYYISKKSMDEEDYKKIKNVLDKSIKTKETLIQNTANYLRAYLNECIQWGLLNSESNNVYRELIRRYVWLSYENSPIGVYEKYMFNKKIIDDIIFNIAEKNKTMNEHKGNNWQIYNAAIDVIIVSLGRRNEYGKYGPEIRVKIEYFKSQKGHYPVSLKELEEYLKEVLLGKYDSEDLNNKYMLDLINKMEGYSTNLNAIKTMTDKNKN